MSNTNLEIIEIEGGNTKLPPQSSQSNQLLHWFFTYNNYETAHLEILEMIFKPLCSSYCFQQETGKDGTPHLQGVISLKKRMRWSEFGLMRQIHWEKPKNVAASYLYCCKPETRTGRVFTFNFAPPKELKLIKEEQFYDWQKKIIDIISNEPDERKVYWFYEHEGGRGKSAFVKFLVAKKNFIPINSGKYSDLMNLIFKSDMDKSNGIVIDIPRNNGNSVSYSAIESIKNGMIVNTKFETGFKLFNSPHLIVFCNEQPDITKLSDDRWVITEI